jgi:hypothetical protein
MNVLECLPIPAFTLGDCCTGLVSEVCITYVNVAAADAVGTDPGRLVGTKLTSSLLFVPSCPLAFLRRIPADGEADLVEDVASVDEGPTLAEQPYTMHRGMLCVGERCVETVLLDPLPDEESTVIVGPRRRGSSTIERNPKVCDTLPEWLLSHRELRTSLVEATTGSLVSSQLCLAGETRSTPTGTLSPLHAAEHLRDIPIVGAALADAMEDWPADAATGTHATVTGSLDGNEVTATLVMLNAEAGLAGLLLSPAQAWEGLATVDVAAVAGSDETEATAAPAPRRRVRRRRVVRRRVMPAYASADPAASTNSRAPQYPEESTRVVRSKRRTAAADSPVASLFARRRRIPLISSFLAAPPRRSTPTHSGKYTPPSVFDCLSFGTTGRR